MKWILPLIAVAVVATAFFVSRRPAEENLEASPKPAESTGEWDLYKTLATIPAEEAFRPLNEGGCPLVGKS